MNNSQNGLKDIIGHIFCLTKKIIGFYVNVFPFYKFEEHTEFIIKSLKTDKLCVSLCDVCKHLLLFRSYCVSSADG